MAGGFSGLSAFKSKVVAQLRFAAALTGTTGFSLMLCCGWREPGAVKATPACGQFGQQVVERLAAPSRSKGLGKAANHPCSTVEANCRPGGGLDITALDTFVSDNVMAPADAAAGDLEQIGLAVEKLASMGARLAELVDLKFFASLSFAEIAALRVGSERTAQRGWDKARALLHGLLQR